MANEKRMELPVASTVRWPIGDAVAGVSYNVTTECIEFRAQVRCEVDDGSYETVTVVTNGVPLRDLVDGLDLPVTIRPRVNEGGSVATHPTSLATDQMAYGWDRLKALSSLWGVPVSKVAHILLSPDYKQFWSWVNADSFLHEVTQ